MVDYGARHELVLIGCIHTETGRDCGTAILHEYASLVGFALPIVYNSSIDQLLEMQKIISKDEEGYVVKFIKTGMRVKIKGHEYVRLQKIISRISPLSLWEVMKDGKVSLKYLEQIPEEIFGEVKPMVESLERNYKNIYNEAMEDFRSLVFETSDDEKLLKKNFAISVQSKKDVRHVAAMFTIFNKKSLDDYILKLIKPVGNVLENI